MVGSIFGALSGVGQALDFIAADSTQDLIKKGKLNLETRGSITRLLSETIIVPTIYVSRELEMHPDIDKIINLNIDILATMVSRAFVLLTQLKGLKATTAFDVLNQKNVMSGLLSDVKKEDEVYENFRNSKGFTFGKKVSAGLLNNNKKPLENSASIKDQGPNFSVPSIYSKDIDFIINVDGKDKGVKITMSIKARIEFISLRELTDALVDRSYDKSFIERIWDIKAGLVPAKNLFIPTDLWEEYKKQLIKDDKDLLKRAEQKDNISVSKLVTTGVQGLNTYLGSLIITADDLEDIEVKVLRGKVNNEAKKDKLLTDTRSSLLNVVDTSYNKLRILTKDNDGDTILGLNSIKKKSDGNDIAELFKMLMISKGL
jgi:hypothetical protein